MARRRVKVDRQGRLVLPRALRDDLVDVPGEVVIERTPEGILLTPVHGPSNVGTGADGLPVLELGRGVTNDEVLTAIDEDRRSR